MARRRGGRTAAPPKTTRQTRNSTKRIKENKVNGVIEDVNNCDGNNGICDANKAEPIVHHKKFGTIRVEEENNQEVEDTGASEPAEETAANETEPPEQNNYTNDVMDIIANISSGTKTRNSLRSSSSVYNVENDIPLDGSVIIKPGTFSSNTITSSVNVQSRVFYDANTVPDLSSNILKMIQSIETGSSSPGYTSPMNDEGKFLMGSTIPAFSEDVKIESEDFYAVSEPPVENLKLEGDDDSETTSKCEDNNCKNMEISSPEDTMSSDVQEEAINKKMENIVIDEGGDASNSPASNEAPDKKSQAFRNRTGSTDTTGSESSSTNGTAIRRSNRIRSIGIMKQKEREQAVKNEATAPGSPVAPPVPGFDDKPVKVKSRWRRSSELEMHSGKQSESETTSPTCSSPVNGPENPTSEPTVEDLKKLEKEKEEVEKGLRSFTALVENEYRTERNACKETKRMICDCVLTKEEIERGEEGCGEDCLNRMLFLECGPRCALGDRCTNKRFQKLQYANCKIFKTEKKGFGLRAEEDLKGNTFIMEYVGEVVDQKEFGRRVKAYAKENNKHFYFMALKGDAVIDATNKGNISRFINHSCDPNAETQKWTINGELRVGFFTKRFVPSGEEITFDYQFQRYGKEAQKCYCEAPTCRGWIGENPDDEEDEEEEDDEDEEEDDEEEVEEEEEEEVRTEKEKEEEEGEGVKEEAKPIDPEKELTPVKKEKPKAARKRKVKEKKEEKVDDIGLEVEIQKLFQTGLKNRAHTLSLSRLMVRAEDWPTKFKLLQLIREGETPCRRLFLDYHGLRLICSWMVSQELEESSDKDERRLEILKTLAKLPIPNKNMLIDSKVLSVVEQWSKCGSLVRKLSVDEEGSDENKKPKEETIPGLGGEIETTGMEVEVKSEGVSESSQKIRTMAESVLESWSSLKEVFKIPKKERLEQMKEHERQADRGYIEYLDNKENVRDKNGRHDRYGRPDRYRNDRNRKRSRDSPTEPDWFRESAKNRKLTKHERRQLFTLKILQEDEMKQWNQHQSQCAALGVDPYATAMNDHQSGFPVFWDHNSTSWHGCPPSAVPSPHHPVPPSPICPSPMYPMGPPPPMCSNIPMNCPPVICRGGMMHNGLHPPPLIPPPNGPLTPTYHNVTPQYQPPIPQPSYEPLPVYQEPQEPIPAPYEEEQDDSVKPELMEVPINAPIKLPPNWKSAKDSLGRVYYYHVKDRISQWIPPAWTEEEASAEAMKAIAAEMEEDSSSSSESSSESSTEEEEEEEEVNEEENEEEPENSISNNPTSSSNNEVNPDPEEAEEEILENPDDREAETKDLEEGEIEDEKPESPVENSKNDFEDEKDEDLSAWEDEEDIVKPKITEEKKEAQPAPAPAPQPSKGRRVGLVQEIIISPRREEDRVDTRKFKETKEMLRRQKEEERRKRGEKPSTRVSKKKRRKEKSTRNIRVKSEKTTAAAESSTDRKIKENFKNNMAGAIVSHLNPYRKQDCKIGRITNNEDFKHLARKLTHFVMLKELKHCRGVDDLECNDSVKAKAKDFIRKYMAKFGAVYQRPLNDNWKA